jgi:hypothetical protein
MAQSKAIELRGDAIMSKVVFEVEVPDEIRGMS